MLSNKEISQNFEVQINTLYNWRKTKPKLYRYLKNADYNFEQNKEINVLLQHLAREIKPSFTPEEISYFVSSGAEANSIGDVEEMEKIFLAHNYKELSKDTDLLFRIYDKLNDLSMIEKYIFYKRVYNLRATMRQIEEEIIIEYFSEFLLK